MSRIDDFLKMAVARNASDIHFSTGEPTRFRVDGDLLPVDNSVLDPDELQSMLLEVLSDVERNKFIKTKNLDKSYLAKGVGNFRMNVFLTRNGIASVLRVIPDKIPTMKDLNLPDSFEKLIQLEKGLILVTGPTGVGKSTTLASLINEINLRNRMHIITVEDPVEFIHKSQKSLVNQREIGSSCDTFADALKYALREDPDVILVGEMRDLETIELALNAAETGHLVFGTLHTRGAAPSIDRIINSFPAEKQAMVRMVLSESLQGVISQQLLKRANGKGRVAAFEVMTVNHAISNLIREGKTFQIPSAIQTARKEGMILMDQYMVELVKQGAVSADEARAFMESPELLPGASKSSVREEPAKKELSVKAQPPPPPKPVAFKPLTAVEIQETPKVEEPSFSVVNQPLNQVEEGTQNAKKPIPIPPPFPKKKVG